MARMTRPLLIATHNANKTREIREMLGVNFLVGDLTAHPEIPATIESGATFEENAKLKALEASRLFKGLVLADDSGLEVDALGGAPGVHSARYAGENATDEDNCRKLLAELARAGARGRKRCARFRCIVALAQDGEVRAMFDGAVDGVIINEPKGQNGFGYDPLFVPDGFCETFAQLPPAIKSNFSHRARAMEKLRPALLSMQT